VKGSILNLALGQIREQIARHETGYINEQNTKAILIEPLLSALGWNLLDLSEVHREYRYQSADNPADYALLEDGKPCVFVEAKALGLSLNERKWSSQVIGYAGVAGVQWVVLTDGNEYRMFNAHASVPVEEKLFCTVRVTDQVPHLTNTLNLLSRDGLQKNLLQARWDSEIEDRRIRHVDQQVQQALQGLVEAARPDAALVRLLGRRINDVDSADIRNSLSRVQISFDYSTTSEDGDSSNPPPAKPDQNPALKRGSKVSLRNIIDAGVFEAPLDIHRTYKKQHHKARIETDGSISFGGKHYSTPSGAGSAVRILHGAPPESAQTAGWSFWRYTDSKGEVKSIDSLRQRYIERQKP
jgi:hypothetical protein